MLVRSLITRSTPPTPTRHTLHRFIILDILPRHSANARTLMDILLALNTSQTAQVFVSLLSPLGNEITISVIFLQQVSIQLFGNGLLLVVQLVDISRSLMMNPINVPQQLVLFFSFSRSILGVFQFIAKLVENLGNVVKSSRWSFGSGRSDLDHCDIVCCWWLVWMVLAVLLLCLCWVSRDLSLRAFYPPQIALRMRQNTVFWDVDNWWYFFGGWFFQCRLNDIEFVKNEISGGGVCEVF